ncbi:MAG TPA: glycerophosphodiester phosphodiesterase family protein [Isosphaeraceae bacterium]
MVGPVSESEAAGPGTPGEVLPRFRRPEGWTGPWVIAHRGDSFHAPENTLEAARLGWEAGASAWEFDVRLTRDDVPVVVHDDSLPRTTDVARRFAGDPRAATRFLVADFDWSEIQSLDAGGWFLEPGAGPNPGHPARTAAGFGSIARLDPGQRAWYASGRVRVPTLAEALALTVELDWAANIELKSSFGGEPALVEAVLAEVDRAGAADRVWISSFDHADVARVGRLHPGLATGVLTATPLYRPARYVREGVGAAAYHPAAHALGSESAGYRRRPSAAMLRAGDLDDLRAAGVPVYVYTVNDARPGGLAEHLAEAGVSGLYSDDPGSLGALWDRPRRRPPSQGRSAGGPVP